MSKYLRSVVCLRILNCRSPLKKRQQTVSEESSNQFSLFSVVCHWIDFTVAKNKATQAKVLWKGRERNKRKKKKSKHKNRKKDSKHFLKSYATE